MKAPITSWLGAALVVTNLAGVTAVSWWLIAAIVFVPPITCSLILEFSKTTPKKGR